MTHVNSVCAHSPISMTVFDLRTVRRFNDETRGLNRLISIIGVSMAIYRYNCDCGNLRFESRCRLYRVSSQNKITEQLGLLNSCQIS